VSAPGRERAAGILLGAGASARMGVDKLWADLGGRPLLAWPIATFAACDCIQELVIVASTPNVNRVERLLSDLRVRARVVPGGERRRDSVRAGLEALGDVEWVVVHDAARPLLTRALVTDGLEAARATGAAIAAVPAVDTIKTVRDGEVVGTLARETLWAAQTPQVFRFELLLEAHRAVSDDVTDDAALVEAIGARVRVYMGAYANINFPSPVDLQLAALLVSENERPLAEPVASEAPAAGDRRAEDA